MGDIAGGISDGLAEGWESSAARNPAAGRALMSAVRKLSRTKSWTRLCCRKRTSVLAGCTFTSTSSGGISRNKSTTGKLVGGITLR